MQRNPYFGVLYIFGIICPSIVVAQDKFEIQVYDSETERPGDFGFEVHINHIFAGSMSPSPDGAMPTNRTSRLTFEPHIGLFDWAEAGFYLQTALRPYGAYDYAGVKLRIKGKYPKKLWDRVGLAVNFEVSSVPRIYEPNQYGSEARLIADAQWSRFYASVNPILSIDLRGPSAGTPRLEPAGKLALILDQRTSLGFEYYGGYGALNQLFPREGQSHILYLAADYSGPFVDLNLGVGYGFAGDDRWLMKAIVGFHPAR